MTEGKAVAGIPAWDRDELTYVIEVAASNSVNKAATTLGVSPATIASWLGLLEERLGYRIFERSPKGAFLTDRGERVVAEARDVLHALKTFERNAAQSEAIESIRVRLSMTDGLATYWVAPNIPLLRDAWPEITLDCMIGPEPADPYLADADLSVRLRAPESSDAKRLRLGYLHFIPYASKDYLAAFGAPRTVADLSNHHIVAHSSYESQRGPWYAWSAQSSLPGRLSLRTNIGAMTVSAIERGLGIGMLPSYASIVRQNLVALDLPIHMRSDLWLCYRKGTDDSPACEHVAGWLADIFSAEAYPCFAEEFLPPHRF
jgi:DNA-binding transcriptional LysR family regulator